MSSASCWSALFLGCLEVTLDRGQRDDWFSSPLITATAVISALSLILFIPWELTREEPIVPIAMFGRRNFGIASIFLLITGVIIFGTTQFIPQLLQQVMGYTATDAGLALTAGGLATIVAMPIGGILSGKVDPRLLIGGAFLVQGLALSNMSHLNTQHVVRRRRLGADVPVGRPAVPVRADHQRRLRRAASRTRATRPRP